MPHQNEAASESAFFSFVHTGPPATDIENYRSYNSSSSALCRSLDADEQDALNITKVADRHFSPGLNLIDQGEFAAEFYVIREGWVMQYEILPDGTRQIFDFLLPGSLVGFSPARGGVSPYAVQALTQVRACSFSRAAIHHAVARHPSLGLKLACLFSADQMRAFHALTLLGRRNAKQRVAALLHDLESRLIAAGYSKKQPVPITQEHIGDALGLTNVHVNRMLRLLREEGVLDLRGGELRVLDSKQLAEIIHEDSFVTLEHTA